MENLIGKAIRRLKNQSVDEALYTRLTKKHSHLNHSPLHEDVGTIIASGDYREPYRYLMPEGVSLSEGLREASASAAHYQQPYIFEFAGFQVEISQSMTHDELENVRKNLEFSVKNINLED